MVGLWRGTLLGLDPGGLCRDLLLVGDRGGAPTRHRRRLAARLAELSGSDVMRTPNVGRFTHQEIDAFLKRHGHRFADNWAVLDPRDEMRIRKYALHCALVVRRRRGGTVLALVERQTKSTIGTYDSWPEVEHAIEQYDAKALRTA
jgi:hypothetical protein